MPAVLHLVNTYLPRTCPWIYRQINGVRGEFRTGVLCMEKSNVDIFPTDSIYCLSEKYPWLPFFALNRSLLPHFPVLSRSIDISKLLDGVRYDLIHAHFGNVGYYGLPLKKRLGLPMITMFYGFDACLLPRQIPVWKRLYRELFAYGDLFLAEGSSMKERLVALGCPEDKVEVLHLGADTKTILCTERKHDKPFFDILMVGSFIEKKGMTYGVDAVAIAAEKEKRVRLTIIGDATGTKASCKEKKRILSAISAKGLGRRVTLLGYQPYEAMIDIMNGCDILMAPSVVARDGDAEGGAPVAIIEAGATGLPVLSTLHCDIPEVVLDTKTGFLVPERDTDALAEKIISMACDTGRLRAMGLAARKHIENEYDYGKQMDKLKTSYGTLIGGRKRAV